MEGPHPHEPALNEYPLQPGLASMIDVFRAMKTGEPYPIKAYVMVQGNPLGGWCEDQQTVRESLLALDFLVDMDLYITPTNSLADIVLPAALGPFERGPDKVIEPLYERWTDERFYVELGHMLNPEMWPWSSVEEWSEWAAAARRRDFTEAAQAGFAVERGNVAPPLDFYRLIDPVTERPVGFATPTGRLEIYSVLAFQHGVDPLPYYVEPEQSPYSAPDLARDYPLVLTTGARLPVYYHSQHRNNPLQRELFPHPQAEINTRTAAEQGIADGDWIWIESKTGKIRMQARVTPGLMPGVVSMAHGWWQGCVELGLPGYGWDGANANLLVSGDEHDPALGVPAVRSQLCRVYKADEPPVVWEPPYYGTTKPDHRPGGTTGPSAVVREEGR
jgi:anaerobic selenocysteine-containing dehydrogenase